MASSSQLQVPTISLEGTVFDSLGKDISEKEARIEALKQELEALTTDVSQAEERKSRLDHGMRHANRILDALFFLPKFSNLRRDNADYQAHVATIQNQLRDIVATDASHQPLFDALDAIFVNGTYIKKEDSQFAFCFPGNKQRDGESHTYVQYDSRPFETLQNMPALLMFLQQNHDPNHTLVNPSLSDAGALNEQNALLYCELKNQFLRVFPQFTNITVHLINL
ncbi:MAG: hypothetical protein ABW189_08325 [Rickettsiales bacterium]